MIILTAVKKPIPIKCIQYTGENFDDICDFCGTLKDGRYVAYKEGTTLKIRTLEGDHTSIVGDYIIKGVHGECYPCKEDIFNETYNIV